LDYLPTCDERKPFPLLFRRTSCGSPPNPVQPRNQPALEALAAEARRDLERLNYPAPNWVQGTAAADDPTLDVLVVGAGMCGQTAGFALLREGVRKIRVIDAAARGDEGPGPPTPAC
jgi:hypothetical protein